MAGGLLSMLGDAATPPERGSTPGRADSGAEAKTKKRKKKETEQADGKRAKTD